MDGNPLFLLRRTYFSRFAQCLRGVHPFLKRFEPRPGNSSFFAVDGVLKSFFLGKKLLLLWKEQVAVNNHHPNEKPVIGIRPVIETYSEPGDIVLDPFAGSGTTGVAARLCGRRGILIEKVWRYYQTALHRLSSTER